MGVKLLYNSVKTEVRSVGDQLETELEDKMGKGKARQAEGAIGALISWGPEKLLIRCCRSPSRVGL